MMRFRSAIKKAVIVTTVIAGGTCVGYWALPNIKQQKVRCSSEHQAAEGKMLF